MCYFSLILYFPYISFQSVIFKYTSRMANVPTFPAVLVQLPQPKPTPPPVPLVAFSPMPNFQAPAQASSFRAVPSNVPQFQPLFSGTLSARTPQPQVQPSPSGTLSTRGTAEAGPLSQTPQVQPSASGTLSARTPQTQQIPPLQSTFVAPQFATTQPVVTSFRPSTFVSPQPQVPQVPQQPVIAQFVPPQQPAFVAPQPLPPQQHTFVAPQPVIVTTQQIPPLQATPQQQQPQQQQPQQQQPQQQQPQQQIPPLQATPQPQVPVVPIFVTPQSQQVTPLQLAPQPVFVTPQAPTTQPTFMTSQPQISTLRATQPTFVSSQSQPQTSSSQPPFASSQSQIAPVQPQSAQIVSFQPPTFVPSFQPLPQVPGTNVTVVDLSQISAGNVGTGSTRENVQALLSTSGRGEQKVTPATRVVSYPPEVLTTYRAVELPSALNIITSFRLPTNSIKFGPITYVTVTAQPMRSQHPACQSIKGPADIGHMGRQALINILGSMNMNTGGSVEVLKATLRRECFGT